MKQAAVSRLNEKLVTHPFLSHNQKYLPNSKITQNLLLLVFFFLFNSSYLFIQNIYLYLLNILKKYSINWCHAIIVRFAAAPNYSNF